MTILEAIQSGLMLFVFVFLVLFVLFVLITVFSAILQQAQKLGKKAAPAAADVAPAAAAPAAVAAPTGGTWGGQLRLKNVDDQTAAMVMAIVSDKSGIPLSELVFKSISLVEPGQNKQEEA